MTTTKVGNRRVNVYAAHGRSSARYAHSSIAAALGLYLSACSGEAELPLNQQGGPGAEQAVEYGVEGQALEVEVDTLLRSFSALDATLQTPAPTLGDPYGRLEVAMGDVASRMQALKDAYGPLDEGAALHRLSIASGQILVQVGRLKRLVTRAGLDAETSSRLIRQLDTVKLASRSLGVAVEEQQLLEAAEPAGVSSELRANIETFSGPLFPGSSWYVLTEGHIDAIDVAYEDEALGISIHDESVDPDVERDPAKTILVAKSSSKWQVPDSRFAFLGPVGTDVWLLPQGQPEAVAADILWPGLATEEVDAGIFLNDEVDVRVRSVIGPNGFSMFESPEDEVAAPLVLVDSENGLPDTITTSVGIHRHMNWAFEAPGIYLVKVQARGRLSEVAGNPWVNSPNVTLTFVVLP